MFNYSKGLSEALEKEKVIRNELEQNKLQEMTEARNIYDEKMQEELLELENASKKKETKSNKSKKAKKGPKIVPPQVDEFTIVNIDSEYVNIDDEQYNNRDKLLDPELLNLTSDEVSIRVTFCELPMRK